MFRALSLFAALVAAAAATNGTVSGIVRDARTGLPLGGVTIHAGKQRTDTDVLGRFNLSDIEPGRQWLSAYAEDRAAAGGRYVTVTPGESLDNVEILLKTGGTISGRVLDSDGKAVPAAAVLLLEPRFESGRTVYTPRDVTTSDEHGAYTLARVPAGAGHLLLAKPKLRTVPPSGLAEDPDKRPPVLAPAYYPGSDRIEGAEAVTLASGQQLSGLDIHIGREHSYCIDGSIEADGASRGSLEVMERRDLAEGWSMVRVNSKLTPNGAFRLCGLHPGDYDLVGRSERGEPITLRETATIVSRDVTGLKMRTRTPLSIQGTVSWRSAPDRKAGRISLSLARAIATAAADEAGARPSLMGGLSYGAKIQVPGAFTLQGIPPEDYSVSIRDTPPGCYVQEATYGGATVLGTMLRLSGGAAGEMRITLACDAGSLRARVVDGAGAAVPSGTLFVIPEDLANPALFPPAMRQLEIRDGWTEPTDSVPPGRYLLLPCNVETDGTAAPILRLWNARSRAKEVSIEPGASAQVTLELIEVP